MGLRSHNTCDQGNISGNIYGNIQNNIVQLIYAIYSMMELECKKLPQFKAQFHVYSSFFMFFHTAIITD